MIPFFSILSLVYVLDLATKTIVRRTFPLGTEKPVLPFFSLTHIENTGIAFGLFQGNNWAFVGIGLVLSIVLIGMAVKTRRGSRLDQVALGLILAGAWGNLTDRILLGRVTDFLDFFIGSVHWPAFNVADSAICVGAGLLILQAFLKGGRLENHVSDPR